MEKKLRKAIKSIKMSEEMEERILTKCYEKMEESAMSKRKSKTGLKNPMVAVASLAVCLCLTGVTVLAATGKLQGYFKDVVRWNKSVVGTTYENATDEINITAYSKAEGTISVIIELNDPTMVPYSEFESMGIVNYEIIDENGTVVMKGEETEVFDIVSGNVTADILLDIPEGNYKFVTTELVGSKKADQPLPIHGTWECEFVY